MRPYIQLCIPAECPYRGNQETFGDIFLNLLGGKWEVWVLDIVLHHIATRFIEKRKERVEGADRCKLHDMINRGGKFKRFFDDSSNLEERFKDPGDAALRIEMRSSIFQGRVASSHR